METAYKNVTVNMTTYDDESGNVSWYMDTELSAFERARELVSWDACSPKGKNRTKAYMRIDVLNKFTHSFKPGTTDAMLDVISDIISGDGEFPAVHTVLQSAADKCCKRPCYRRRRCE